MQWQTSQSRRCSTCRCERQRQITSCLATEKVGYCEESTASYCRLTAVGGFDDTEEMVRFSSEVAAAASLFILCLGSPLVLVCHCTSAKCYTSTCKYIIRKAVAALWEHAQPAFLGKSLLGEHAPHLRRTARHIRVEQVCRPDPNTAQPMPPHHLCLQCEAP